MADAHTNFAVSTVATAPSPATSGTSLVVASGDGALFASFPFNATIAPAGVPATSANAEIVRITGRSTDTLTITRAQEGTAARTVVVGDRIFVSATKRVFERVEGQNPRVLYPEDYGALGDGTTDDTTAFRSMMSAIDMTYGADIVLDPTKTYLVNGAPDTTKFGNAIIPLPLTGGILGTRTNYPFADEQATIRIRSLWGNATIKTTRTTDTYANGPATTLAAQLTAGATSASLTSAASWPASGTFVCESEIIKYASKTGNTLNTLTRGMYGTTDATHVITTAATVTYGSPSVIGGPTPEQGGTTFSSLGNVEISGIVIQCPNNPAISGLDLQYAGRADIEVIVNTPQTSGKSGSLAANADAVTAPTNKWAFGVRGPNSLNQGHIDWRRVAVKGFYVAVVLFQSHNVIRDIYIDVCVCAFGIQGTGTGHGSELIYAIMTNTQYGFAGWDAISGVRSLSSNAHFYITGGKLDYEVTTSTNWPLTQLVLDANNLITGRIYLHVWPIGSAYTVSGATNLQLQLTGGPTMETYVPYSIGTTKGDTISFTGSAAPVRVPVGADNSVLTAASIVGYGVAWAVPPGTNLFNQFADGTASVTTTKTDLYTETIPAATLTANGMALEVTYAGLTVAHATATRTFTVEFASTAIFTSAAIVTATSGHKWRIEATIMRQSNTVCRYSVQFLSSRADTGAVGVVYASQGSISSLNFTTTGYICKVTGQGGTGSSTGDIVATMEAIRLFRQA